MYLLVPYKTYTETHHQKRFSNHNANFFSNSYLKLNLKKKALSRGVAMCSLRAGISFKLGMVLNIQYFVWWFSILKVKVDIYEYNISSDYSVSFILFDLL